MTSFQLRGGGKLRHAAVGKNGKQVGSGDDVAGLLQGRGCKICLFLCVQCGKMSENCAFRARQGWYAEAMRHTFDMPTTIGMQRTESVTTSVPTRLLATLVFQSMRLFGIMPSWRPASGR